MDSNSNSLGGVPQINAQNTTSNRTRSNSTRPKNSSGTTATAASALPDVFLNQSNHYRLNVYPFPPYVIDTLNKGGQELGEDSQDPEKNHNSSTSKEVGDPFVNTFLSKDKSSVLWDKFIRTLKSDVAYPAKAVHYDDSSSIIKSYDLDSEWKGAEELNDYFENRYTQDGNKKKDNDYKYKKFRSKAGYWIYENKKDLQPKFMDALMTSMYFPLFCRIFNLVLSSVTVALSARLIELSHNFQDKVADQTSSIMAVVVQSVALVYLLYVAYDEFSSQPIGLRNPRAKIRLVLLDLLFIIFSSANLALSFNTLYDPNWICKLSSSLTSQQQQELILSSSDASLSIIHTMCEYQRTLAAFLFVILVFWLLTFLLSIFRIVSVVSYHNDAPRY